MKLQIRVDKDTNVISDVRFKTFGCGSAIASSSYLTELVRGMTLEEAGKIKNTEIARELCKFSARDVFPYTSLQFTNNLRQAVSHTSSFLCIPKTLYPTPCSCTICPRPNAARQSERFLGGGGICLDVPACVRHVRENVEKRSLRMGSAVCLEQWGTMGYPRFRHNPLYHYILLLRCVPNREATISHTIPILHRPADCFHCCARLLNNRTSATWRYSFADLIQCPP
jgi:hypothetical protein